MRNFLGGLVFLAGVGGLGLYGSSNHAERMQADVAAGAANVAGSALQGVQASVAGRDITVTGVADTQAEFDALQAAFNAVDGRRVIDMSGVSILPVANPFTLTARRADGSTTLAGAIPSETDRAILAAATSDGAASALALSSGAPDAAWADVAARAVAVLDGALSGELALSDRALTLRALVPTPAEAAVAKTALGGLPAGYTVDVTLDVQDDGTPLRLTATRDASGVSVAGKVPAGYAVADNVPEGAREIVEAAVPMGDAGWPEAATAGLSALAALEEGNLSLEGMALTLSGAATPDGKARAEALVAALPDGYSARSDIALFDDGAPFQMQVSFDGRSIAATGKRPANYVPVAPQGLAFSSAGEAAFVNDETGGFQTNADAALAALALLENGAATVSADSVILTGLALSPAQDAAIDAALAEVAGSATKSLDYLDDGTPPDWRLAYTATNGAGVDGKLPSDLSAVMIKETIGLNDIAGEPSASLTQPDQANALATLAIVSEYLPETERLNFVAAPGGASLDLVLSPGVNSDLVAADLAERLPANVAFTVSPLETLPAVGDVRTNQATLLRERFQFGNWLPIQTFAPVASICTDQAQAVLSGGGVTFLSASAQLDAKSIRAINALSSIAQRCVGEGGLTLEIAGHTDSSGSEISNQLLSENRANAVRDALVARGVDALSIVSTGYGQTRPLADNETPEGRAQNRRTEFIWSE